MSLWVCGHIICRNLKTDLTWEAWKLLLRPLPRNSSLYHKYLVSIQKWPIDSLFLLHLFLFLWVIIFDSVVPLYPFPPPPPSALTSFHSHFDHSVTLVTLLGHLLAPIISTANISRLPQRCKLSPDYPKRGSPEIVGPWGLRYFWGQWVLTSVEVRQVILIEVILIDRTCIPSMEGRKAEIIPCGGLTSNCMCISLILVVTLRSDLIFAPPMN